MTKEKVFSYQPSILWNDIGFPAKLDTKVLYADFTTPEYTSLKQIAVHKWEIVRGLGYSFGYNQNETADHMLSVQDLIHMLADIVSKNGNLLLNIGPKADGSISALQLERVQGLGKWLRTNGEAIYTTRPWVMAEVQTADGIPVRFTQKGGSLYAILLGSPLGEQLRFPAQRFTAGTKACLLGDERPSVLQTETSALTLPGRLTETPAYILHFTPSPVLVKNFIGLPPRFLQSMDIKLATMERGKAYFTYLVGLVTAMGDGSDVSFIKLGDTGRTCAYAGGIAHMSKSGRYSTGLIQPFIMRSMQKGSRSQHCLGPKSRINSSGSHRKILRSKKNIYQHSKD